MVTIRSVGFTASVQQVENRGRPRNPARRIDIPLLAHVELRQIVQRDAVELEISGQIVHPPRQRLDPEARVPVLDHPRRHRADKFQLRERRMSVRAMEQRKPPVLLRKSAGENRRNRRSAESQHRIERTPIRRNLFQERMLLDPFPAQRVHQYEDTCFHRAAGFLTIASNPDPCRVGV